MLTCTIRIVSIRAAAALAAGGMLLGAVAAFAQHEQSKVLSEADMLLGDIPMVRVASRLVQPANLAPASVTILSRELLEMSGAQDWVDVFRLVPGFQSYSVNANRTGVSYHGFGSEHPNRLEVMVDGRSVYEPVFSTVIWNALGIQLEDVDYIEIVRGPSAASHGSNAFLGAVNIVTRQPLQSTGAEVRMSSGSRSTRNAFFRLNDSIGALNYRISGGYRHNEGFPGQVEGGLDDGRELYQMSFIGTLTPSLHNAIDIGFGYTNDKVGFGDGDHPDEYIPSDFYADYQFAKWHHTLASGDELRIHAYHNGLKIDNATTLGLVSELLGVSPMQVPFILGVPDQAISAGLGSLRSERMDLEFEHQLSVTDEIRMVWGLGLRSEYTKSKLLHGRDSKITEESGRAFGHAEWQPLPAWRVNAGVMIEDTFVGTLASPRVSVSYLLNQTQTLRLSAAHGRRAPSITEANLNQFHKIGDLPFNAIIRSDPRLKEEKISAVELAWTGSFADGALTADVNVFREEARDAIDAFEEDILLPLPIFDDEIKVKSNTAEWESTGVELQLSYRPIHELQLRIHYAYLDLDSFFVRRFEPDQFVGDFNNARPRHAGGLLFNYRLAPNVHAGFTGYYQSDTQWRGGNAIDEYVRIDAQATWQFALGENHAKVQLVAQNIGGDYSEYSRLNVFESRYHVAFSLELP